MQPTTHIQLTDTDFSEMDFSGQDLREAYFSCCNFKGANFSGTDLSHAKFHNCWLDNANFTEATVQKAIFSKCTLVEANLTHSNFYKTIFPFTTVRNVILDGIRQVNQRSRQLIGEMLRQHADGSSQKLLFALQIGHDINICWAQWIEIAKENPVYLHWAIQVFKLYPESRLLETILDREERPMAAAEIDAFHAELTCTTIPASHLALCEVNGTAYALDTRGRNLIRADMTLGVLRHHQLEKNYTDDKEDRVAIVIENTEAYPALEAIQGLRWPFPAKGIPTRKQWLKFQQEHFEELKEGERQAARYIGSAVTLDGKQVFLHEPYEALGVFPAELARLFPNAHLKGGNKENEGQTGADFCIFRNLGHGQSTKAEGKTILKQGLLSLEKGGTALFFSFSPPLFSPTELAEFGTVEEKQIFHADGMSLIYLLKTHTQ